MRVRWPAVPARLRLIGALGAVTTAIVVYGQFDLHGKLSRDSAIYIYGGQRLTHGVPPYASIMDPKGPLAGILCGFGAAVARLFGRSDVLTIRVEFCALAVLAALGVYLLTLQLWDSVVAAVVAAAVFVWFRQYAHQALAGPDGHAPGVLFLIFALWLTVRRQWYLAGCATSLAFVVWQPLFAYPLMALVCAALWPSPGHRLRAVGRCLAGIATPLVALMIYYAAEGDLGKLLVGLFVFPLTAARRRPTPFGDRVQFIIRNIDNSYAGSAILLWAGLLLLLGLAAWAVISARPHWRAACLQPVVLLIVLSLVAQVAYVLYDYIGWTHAFPLLPYAALGIGGATAVVLREASAPRARQVAATVVLAGAAVLTAVFAVSYNRSGSMNDLTLRIQQVDACAIRRSLAPGTPLWTLGDPIPLVLLHRVNPDNYPYEGSGLDVWKVEHTQGGFAGWTGEIAASRASVVVLDAWKGPYKLLMEDWLRSHGYRAGYIGPFRVYVTPAAQAQMTTHSIRLAGVPLDWPLTPDRQFSRNIHCATVPAG